MPAMKKINTRFGEVEYDPDNTVSFPEGLLGFESLRNFIIMPNVKKGPLFWIQSVEDPEVAFVITDPTNFFPDFMVKPEKTDRQKLGIKEDGLCFVLSVVTVSPEKQVTLNMKAPILFSPETNKAIQVILENLPYSTREPLPT